MSTNQYTTAVKYPVVEIQSTLISNELGDWSENAVAKRGTTLSIIRQQPRLIVDAMNKHCLANMVKGLPAATTIVHIPHTTSKGEQLDMTQWTQGFWYAVREFGVPMWTQSSIKCDTFYCVKPEMFAKLTASWDLNNDGPKFAAYGGLLYSEMDDDAPLSFNLKGFEAVDDGQDGNCAVPPEVWGNVSCQFRLMRLDKLGMPAGIGKGIAVPLNDSEPEFNTTQIKWGGGKGRYLVLRNRYVSARPIKMWISAEPLLMLKDTPEVRQFVSQRVQREVGQYLSLLTEEHRADLVKRLGGLNMSDKGALESSKRAVIEALRSKMPWCKEIEERVTRFAIKEICESIVPSGAIRGFASLMVISDQHGVKPCTWKEAKVVAFRIPVTGSNAIIPLPKDPFVKGKGNVVHSDVAKLADGDADGDLLVVVREAEVVELFRKYLNHDIVTTQKPEKTRAKAELTAEFMTDLAIEQVSQNWQVGALTVAGWKMIQAGDFKSASDLMALANWQPMTAKWNVELDGKPFSKYVSGVFNKMRDPLKKIVLQWREKAAESRGFDSPRQISETRIVEPASHLDVAWNAGVEAARLWKEANPLVPLSLTKVARIAFGERGIVIPGSAWREAREMIEKWGKYWTAIHESNTMAGDHGYIYRAAAAWGHSASHEAIAAMLVWRPKNAENTGFSLKWHAVFSAGRAAEVLGLHPAIAESIKELRDERTDLERTMALVEALLESIE